MNILRFSILSLTLAIAVVTLGYLNPAFAAKPGVCDPPSEPPHPSCKPDAEPPPDDPPALEACPAGELCIADVGSPRTNTPAREFAGRFGALGNYTVIESNQFSQILATLTEEEPAQALCDAYHVVIINWGSPKIKLLNGQRLLDYLTCGGGVVFEDPKHVEALAPFVVTDSVEFHSREKEPLPITLAVVPILTVGDPLTADFDPLPTATFTLPFVNNHIIFAPSNGLTSFLTLADGAVVGLYGQFGAGLGRIVLTGPDNNFHGDDASPDNDPNQVQNLNHYNLLFNELLWILEGQFVLP